jgi:hypothetical protein
MTEDNVVTQEVVKEVKRNGRGEIGVASTGETIKKLHRTEGHGLSLKEFAHKLANAGNQIAKDWFAHKRGSLNKNRNDANCKAAIEARTATKASRRKVKAQK